VVHLQRGGLLQRMVGDAALLALGLLVVGGVPADRVSRPLVGAASAAGTAAVIVMLLAPYLAPASPSRSRSRNGGATWPGSSTPKATGW
jgi:hypothetical protein